MNSIKKFLLLYLLIYIVKSPSITYKESFYDSLFISNNNANNLPNNEDSDVSYTSIIKYDWDNPLSDEEAQKYKEMIDLKVSFTLSLSFLSKNFTPEKEEYWANLEMIIIIFTIIAIFPLAFIIFYFIMRFIFKKCTGPKEIKQVGRTYRNFTWMLFIASSGVIFGLFTSIVVYSAKGK